MRALAFRPARPDDADAVVPLIHDSSRALLDYSFAFLGADAAAFVRHDFLRGGGFFGWRQQLVATGSDGVIVGSLTAYAGREVGRLGNATTRSVLSHFGLLRTVAVAWRSWFMRPLFITPRPDALFVANVCVAPPLRSQGIGRRLVEHAIAAHADRGLAVVELDVSFANVGAERLYRRMGFRVVAERPYHGRRALDGFRRLARPLTDATEAARSDRA
jgi:ribosomal protein S18 acetylase RimI-like enzyme